MTQILSSGHQFSATRKFLIAFPIVLSVAGFSATFIHSRTSPHHRFPPLLRFLITTAYAGHAPGHFWPNLLAMALVVVAKSPLMHKVRGFDVIFYI